MAQSETGDEETEGGDDDEQVSLHKKLAFWEGVLNSAFSAGVVFLETFTCECGMKNFMVHVGSPTMKCVKCDSVRPSTVNRSAPTAEDAEEAKLPLAVRTLRRVHEQMQAEAPALALHEIMQQPEAMRMLLVRHRATVAIETLKSVVALAEEMALRDG